MTSQTFTGDEAIKKYFINQYIQAASAYDPRSYILDVEKVRLLSTPAIYNDFRRRINPRKLGADSRIKVRIKSIQFPRATTAQVRVVRDTITKGSGSSSVDELITINFSFNPKIKLTMEERLVNPLGPSYKLCNF
ncbi:MAG: type IV secretion system protein [Proteobacteria bacterium]|nr:type IV secretion system protein [Pseudomonadota bacterium]